MHRVARSAATAALARVVLNNPAEVAGLRMEKKENSACAPGIYALNLGGSNGSSSLRKWAKGGEESSAHNMIFVDWKGEKFTRIIAPGRGNQGNWVSGLFSRTSKAMKYFDNVKCEPVSQGKALRFTIERTTGFDKNGINLSTLEVRKDREHQLLHALFDQLRLRKQNEYTFDMEKDLPKAVEEDISKTNFAGLLQCGNKQDKECRDSLLKPTIQRVEVMKECDREARAFKLRVGTLLNKNLVPLSCEKLPPSEWEIVKEGMRSDARKAHADAVVHMAALTNSLKVLNNNIGGEADIQAMLLVAKGLRKYHP